MSIRDNLLYRTICEDGGSGGGTENVMAFVVDDDNPELHINLAEPLGGGQHIGISYKVNGASTTTDAFRIRVGNITKSMYGADNVWKDFSLSVAASMVGATEIVINQTKSGSKLQIFGVVTHGNGETRVLEAGEVVNTSSLLAYDKIEGGGSDITVTKLVVSENGTYEKEGLAFSPVVVDVKGGGDVDYSFLFDSEFADDVKIKYDGVISTNYGGAGIHGGRVTFDGVTKITGYSTLPYVNIREAVFNDLTDVTSSRFFDTGVASNFYAPNLKTMTSFDGETYMFYAPNATTGRCGTGAKVWGKVVLGDVTSLNMFSTISSSPNVVDVLGATTISTNGNVYIDSLVIRGDSIPYVNQSYTRYFHFKADVEGGVYVPDALVNTYKAHQYWTWAADYIKPLSEYTGNRDYEPVK